MWVSSRLFCERKFKISVNCVHCSCVSIRLKFIEQMPAFWQLYFYIKTCSYNNFRKESILHREENIIYLFLTAPIRRYRAYVMTFGDSSAPHTLCSWAIICQVTSLSCLLSFLHNPYITSFLIWRIFYLLVSFHFYIQLYTTYCNLTHSMSNYRLGL